MVLGRRGNRYWCGGLCWEYCGFVVAWIVDKREKNARRSWTSGKIYICLLALVDQEPGQQLRIEVRVASFTTLLYHSGLTIFWKDIRGRLTPEADDLTPPSNLEQSRQKER